MAARFLSSEIASGISSLSGLIDDKLFEILSLFDSANHTDLAKQINSNFTKAALLENRRKIFDVAVVKERERRALATEQQHRPSTDEAHEQAYSVPTEIAEWQLANRGTKPKTVDDIIQLALFVDDVEVGFPECTLAKCSLASKAKVNNSRQPRIDSALCATVREKEKVGSDKSENQTQANRVIASDVQKSFERFIIRESYQTSDTDTCDVSTPVDIVKLKDSSTSTVEPPVRRSIATQTPPSDICPFVCSRDSPCKNACCTFRAVLSSNTSNNFAISENSGVSDHTLPSNSVVSAVIIPSKDNQPVPELNSGDSDITSCTITLDQVQPVCSTPVSLDANKQAEDSLLNYIDAEFESVKKGEYTMCADRRKIVASRDQDKRIAVLENKYERVAKRLDFVEKDHTKELCEIRAELRRQAYLNASRCNVSSNDLGSYGAGLSHESMYPISEPISLPQMHVDNQTHRGRINTDLDDSSWDTGSTGTIVLTQDSQGKQIPTRATPFHLKEIAANKSNGGTAKPNQVTRPNRCEIGKQGSNAPSKPTTSGPSTKSSSVGNVDQQQAKSCQPTQPSNTGKGKP